MRRWPDWLSSGLTLERLGTILKDADQGNLQDMMTLLQEIAGREPLLNGLLSVRLSSLSQRTIEVQPNKQDKDTVRAQAVAEHYQRIVDDLKLARSEGEGLVYYGGLQSVIESILMTVYYGAEVGWINWAERDGCAQPIAIEFLDERRLYHDIATDKLHIMTDKSGYSGVPLSSFDPMLVLEIRNTRLSRRVAMAGFGRSILLSWWLRFGTLKDLTNYVETWGRPGLLVTANDNTTGYDEDQYEQLQKFLEDYMGDTRVLLPPGFEAELLEAQSGGEKIFETVDSMTERHIQFAAVGQVGAIAGDATTYAAGKQAQRVRDDLTDGDARLVSEVLEKLGRYATAAYFGADVPGPRVEFSSEKSTGAIKEKALAIQAASYPLISMLKGGIPVEIRLYCEEMGIQLTADGNLDPQYLRNLKMLTQMGVASGASQAEQETV
jgi:phage gp29-like protein